jgi:DNA-directed RNA polymerase subunit RPC12/RpoP
MDDKLITVLTVTYPHELIVIRGRLESEGIACFAQDELTVQVNPFYSNAIGGIKLQVRESDYSKAVEILEQDVSDCLESGEPIEIDDANIEDDTAIKCPHCGSKEVLKAKLSPKAFVISVLLLGFPIPFMSKTYHCFGCGKEFKG